jgi:hypothetical protein
MGDPIDAPRQAANHRHPRRGEGAGEHLRLADPVTRRQPRADDRHRAAVARLDRAPAVEHRRRVGDLAQPGRVLRVAERQHPDPVRGGLVEHPRRILDRRRPEDRLGQLGANAPHTLQVARVPSKRPLRRTERLHQPAAQHRPHAANTRQPHLGKDFIGRRSGVKRGVGHSGRLVGGASIARH